MPVIRDQGQRPHVVVVERRQTVSVPVPAREAVAVATPGPQGGRGERGPAGPDASGQIPPHPFAWGDAPANVFEAPSAGVLTIVRLQFTEAFNDPAAVVLIGTADDPGAAMPGTYNDPARAIEFENSPDLSLAEGEAVRLHIHPASASQGAGLLFLTFLPT